MAMRLPAEDPDEGKREMRAARRETLQVFGENPHGPEWTRRFIEAIRHEHEVAERWGL
jgi:hypothetical protein